MTFAAQQLVAHVQRARHSGTAERRRRVPNGTHPKLIEADYAHTLVGVIDEARRTAGRVLLPDLSSLLRTDDTRASRARRTVGRVRAEAEAGTNDTALEGVAERYGKRVSGHQRSELGRQVRAGLGVDPVFHDPKIAHLIDGFTHENVALIKSLRGRCLDDIEKLITRAVASGQRAEAIGPEIEARFGVAERHARLIARDQIARLSSNITEARHAEIGIVSFIWQTMRDPRVRREHVELEGKQFEYAKPPSEGLPGRARRPCCRCLAKPVFDDIHAELDALGV